MGSKPEMMRVYAQGIVALVQYTHLVWDVPKLVHVIDAVNEQSPSTNGYCPVVTVISVAGPYPTSS